ncbi:hypothetical protein O181_094987 [Austropuccinia psidii MF-1]|uniref:Uncharacterized protein n=1 Tax=Austropuccinia psidii MF-1 TaxID=1389203 RepID=A0A9Q3J4H4_9BASI|nr:hypothetical protein [Austropuccinia psidii MF-1]
MGAPVEEELGLMRALSTISEMRGVEDVSLLSPWRINPLIGYKQEGLPSAQFQSLAALPPHPTAPPGRHEKIKEEGCYNHSSGVRVLIDTPTQTP